MKIGINRVAGLKRFMSVFGFVTPVILLFTLILGAAQFLSDVRRSDGVRISPYEMIGRDFVNIWQGGQMAAAGQSARVYDRPAYREDLKKNVGISGIFAFSYPPHMLAFSVPFGALPYIIALTAWSLLTLGLFTFAARPWLREAELPLWTVLLLPGTINNLASGHFGALIGALALIGWRNAAARPLASGAAFALMTVKPHLGVLVPLGLAVYGRWRVILIAAIGTTLLVAGSTFLLGPQIWMVWIKSTLPFQASLIGGIRPDVQYLYMMPTVERTAASLGVFGIGSILIQIGFGVATIGILLRSWKAGDSVATLGLLSIIATFLILPYVFTYDMVAFDLAILVLAARFGAHLSQGEKAVLGIAFLLPLINYPLALHGLGFSSLFILAALWILANASQRARA